MTEEEIWGIHHEVVVSDCYRLKELRFVPDVIFDIGANIGVFSEYAGSLFSKARIIAVEPDKRNIEQFRARVHAVENLAIGHGSVYHMENLWGGAQECYHTKMMGYHGLSVSERYSASEVESITLDILVKAHLGDGERFILKIDCEGAENAIFDHSESMEIMKAADYIAMELHYFSADGCIREATDNILRSLEATHDCKKITNMFYATKKGI